MPSRKVWILIVFLMLTHAAGRLASGQSLAEVAKKEKERRAQVKSTVRVLSNADVDKYQKGAVTTGTYGAGTENQITPPQPLPPPATAASAAGAAQTPGGAGIKDEAYWRFRFKEISDKNRALDNKLVLARLQLNELRNRFYSEADGFFRETIQRDIDKKLAEIEELKQALEGAQNELENFKREARRNNVPAGWIR